MDAVVATYYPDGPHGLPGVVPKKAPCFYAGEKLKGHEKHRLNLGTVRAWRPCHHPEKPLGEHVCGCLGCGPTCSGYTPVAQDSAQDS